MKLYLPPGSDVLASRDAHGLSYPIQRLSRIDRSLERVRRVRLRCGGGPNVLEPFPPRPKGMRRNRYERLWLRYAEEAQRHFGLLKSRWPATGGDFGSLR